MKQKTTIILIILGFIIFLSLCSCKHPSVEGLNTMKKNTHVLERGEYMDDVGYLKSEDGSYNLKLRNGKLKCKRKENGKWKDHWTMNASGSKIMLLNDYGILQFKTSKDAEYIPVTETKDAQSLLLTAYGTLELKSETNGKGDTLWTYPVTEGYTPDTADTAVKNLMGHLELDRSEQARRVIHRMNNTANGDTAFNDVIPVELLAGWAYVLGEYESNNDSTSISTHVTTAIPGSDNTHELATINSDAITTLNTTSNGYDGIDSDKIAGDHQKLLQNDRKLKRLRNTLDNKVKVLNQLGDSHVTEKQMHLDSTIYISLAWTVVASSLVYYTFTQ